MAEVEVNGGEMDELLVCKKAGGSVVEVYINECSQLHVL
jgi:hypothetical protein